MTPSRQEIDHPKSSSSSSTSPPMTSSTVSSEVWLDKKGETRAGWIIIPQLCQVKVWIDKHGETRWDLRVLHHRVIRWRACPSEDDACFACPFLFVTCFHSDFRVSSHITLHRAQMSHVPKKKNWDTHTFLKFQQSYWLSQPKTQNQIQMRITIKNGETRAIPKYRKCCKKSEKISWMIEFLNTETHTQVLLMDHL